MALDILLLAIGLFCLMVGGEGVVRGATGLARALGVSPLVIGLTVVAFGTSAPEMAVNVIAAWQDRGAIAFGNIIGSNMANIGLIVGCTAFVRPIVITGVVIAREIPMMLLATAAAIIMALDCLLAGGGTVPAPENAYGRADGLLLLLLFLVFLYYTVGDFVKQRARNGERAERESHKALDAVGAGQRPQGVAKNLLITAFGLAALIGGARVTVDAAVDVARIFGVPEEVIGLTVLAVGTSLPELVASVTATVRGHAELAIGNVVGSNIFNLLLVLGVTTLIGSVPVPLHGEFDLAVVALFSLILFLVSMTNNRRILRTEATLLLALYFSYLGWRSVGFSIG
jgi:cation:H+ antiporter